jgi:hypothetical protein
MASWCSSSCWCGNPHPRNMDEARNWDAVKKYLPPCFCRQCEDNRVLAVLDECGGSYYAARKQVALEAAVYKARLRDVNSSDPQARELARDYLRKAAM